MAHRSEADADTARRWGGRQSQLSNIDTLIGKIERESEIRRSMELELLDFEIAERKRLAAVKKAAADGALAMGPMGKGAKKEEKDKKQPKTRAHIVRAANTKRELLQIESSDRLGLRFYKARHCSTLRCVHLNQGRRGVGSFVCCGRSEG